MTDEQATAGIAEIEGVRGGRRRFQWARPLRMLTTAAVTMAVLSAPAAAQEQPAERLPPDAEVVAALSLDDGALARTFSIVARAAGLRFLSCLADAGPGRCEACWQKAAVFRGAVGAWGRHLSDTEADRREQYDVILGGFNFGLANRMVPQRDGGGACEDFHRRRRERNLERIEEFLREHERAAPR